MLKTIITPAVSVVNSLSALDDNEFVSSEGPSNRDLKVLPPVEYRIAILFTSIEGCHDLG
jgi:hypothetical protein